MASFSMMVFLINYHYLGVKNFITTILQQIVIIFTFAMTMLRLIFVVSRFMVYNDDYN